MDGENTDSDKKLVSGQITEEGKEGGNSSFAK
jgi:hypothetical protein